MFLGFCNSLVGDATLVGIIRTIYNVIRIGVPLLLIIIGMVDMAKAVTAGKEDEIKKAQGILIKRAVAALIVFLLLSGVKLLLSTVGADKDKIDDNMTITECLDAILNDKKPETNVGNGETQQVDSNQQQQPAEG